MCGEIRERIEEIERQKEQFKADLRYEKIDTDTGDEMIKQKLVGCELALLKERQERQLKEKKYLSYE